MIKISSLTSKPNVSEGRRTKQRCLQISAEDNIAISAPKQVPITFIVAGMFCFELRFETCFVSIPPYMEPADISSILNKKFFGQCTNFDWILFARMLFDLILGFCHYGGVAVAILVSCTSIFKQSKMLSFHKICSDGWSRVWTNDSPPSPRSMTVSAGTGSDMTLVLCQGCELHSLTNVVTMQPREFFSIVARWMRNESMERLHYFCIFCLRESLRFKTAQNRDSIKYGLRVRESWILETSRIAKNIHDLYYFCILQVQGF